MVMSRSRLTKSIPIAVSVLAFTASSYAQSKRVEINPFFGYTLSDGVDVDPFIVGGNTYNAINPKSGIGYGAQFGFFVNENMEVGFLLSRQDSKLEAKGPATVDFTDMSVMNYHAIFTYNWGDEDAKARPFLFGGLGATQFSPSDVSGVSIDGSTKFSTTWGGGVKAYASPHVGFTGMLRWTPTYIKSDPGGIWCSPYWFYGCYYVSDPNYANQFEITGGVSFRF
jgi:opacity protein-like surface antigen